MRIHVISDMEGVSGIVRWQQVNGGDPMYDEGRERRLPRWLSKQLGHSSFAMTDRYSE